MWRACVRLEMRLVIKLVRDQRFEKTQSRPPKFHLLGQICDGSLMVWSSMCQICDGSLMVIFWFVTDWVLVREWPANKPDFCPGSSEFFVYPIILQFMYHIMRCVLWVHVRCECFSHACSISQVWSETGHARFFGNLALVQGAVNFGIFYRLVECFAHLYLFVVV